MPFSKRFVGCVGIQGGNGQNFGDRALLLYVVGGVDNNAAGSATCISSGDNSACSRDGCILATDSTGKHASTDVVMSFEDRYSIIECGCGQRMGVKVRIQMRAAMRSMETSWWKLGEHEQ